jgi:hypothetical protein
MHSKQSLVKHQRREKLGCSRIDGVQGQLGHALCMSGYAVQEPEVHRRSHGCCRSTSRFSKVVPHRPTLVALLCAERVKEWELLARKLEWKLARPISIPVRSLDTKLRQDLIQSSTVLGVEASADPDEIKRASV